MVKMQLICHKTIDTTSLSLILNYLIFQAYGTCKQFGKHVTPSIEFIHITAHATLDSAMETVKQERIISL